MSYGRPSHSVTFTGNKLIQSLFLTFLFCLVHNLVTVLYLAPYIEIVLSEM